MKYINFFDFLSLQRFIYYLSGGRGIGKTYGAQSMTTKHFVDKGYQFLWIRRYKAEIKEQKNGFYNKLKNDTRFKDLKFLVKGNDCYINNKLAGCFIALTSGVINKGNSKLNNIKYIIFDEYVADMSDIYHGYLPNEMKKIYDIIETFARLNDVQIFFLSNNYSEVNPLCLVFNIKFNDKGIFKNDIIYAEKHKTPEEFKKEKINTNFAKLVSRYDPDYFNYNLDNTSFADTENFIKKRNNNAVQIYNILIGDKSFKVYRGRDEYFKPCFFISLKGDNSTTRLKYTLDERNISENVIYLDRDNIAILKNLVNAFKRGKVFFENQEIKYTMFETFKKYLY